MSLSVSDISVCVLISILLAFQQSELQDVIDRNTQLTVQNSDLQKRLQELEKVSTSRCVSGVAVESSGVEIQRILTSTPSTWCDESGGSRTKAELETGMPLGRGSRFSCWLYPGQWHNIFRPSATASRIGLFESCTRGHCCGGPSLPHVLIP